MKRDNHYVKSDPIVEKFNYRVINCLMDIIGSLVLLLIIFPVYGSIAIIILLNSVTPTTLCLECY